MERSDHIIQLIGLFILLLLPSSLLAQEEKFLVNKGNKAYEKGDYIQAMDLYDQAKEIDPSMEIAEYNSADVLYQEKKYEEAIEKYSTLAETLEDEKLKSKALHNLGNSFLEAQQYDQSVKAFKQSLKLNPEDEDTRYNLAYAMNKLKQQQDQNQQNQQNQ